MIKFNFITFPPQFFSLQTLRPRKLWNYKTTVLNSSLRINMKQTHAPLADATNKNIIK